jgi:hypothetical protein
LGWRVGTVGLSEPGAVENINREELTPFWAPKTADITPEMFVRQRMGLHSDILTNVGITADEIGRTGGCSWGDLRESMASWESMEGIHGRHGGRPSSKKASGHQAQCDGICGRGR